MGRRRGSALLGLLLVLVAPLLLLLTSRSADAVTLCLPKADETACIAGTMGSRANPLDDVDVILTKPDGSTETQTTEDGRQVRLHRHRARRLPGRRRPGHPAQGLRAAPRGRGGPPRSRRRAQGRRRPARQVVRRDADRPRRQLRRLHQHPGRGPPVQRQRDPARAAAGPGQRRPQPDLRHHRDLANFAHAEQVTLGGMLGYLSSSTWTGCPLLDRRRPGGHRVRRSAAGCRTASSGNRCEGAGWG